MPRIYGLSLNSFRNLYSHPPPRIPDYFRRLFPSCVVETCSAQSALLFLGLSHTHHPTSRSTIPQVQKFILHTLITLNNWAINTIFDCTITVQTGQLFITILFNATSSNTTLFNTTFSSGTGQGHVLACCSLLTQRDRQVCCLGRFPVGAQVLSGSVDRDN